LGPEQGASFLNGWAGGMGSSAIGVLTCKATT
jgi:hypothetical protein